LFAVNNANMPVICGFIEKPDQTNMASRRSKIKKQHFTQDVNAILYIMKREDITKN
jgi:hypothetical protein